DELGRPFGLAELAEEAPFAALLLGGEGEARTEALRAARAEGARLDREVDLPDDLHVLGPLRLQSFDRGFLDRLPGDLQRVLAGHVPASARPGAGQLEARREGAAEVEGNGLRGLRVARVL